MSSHEEESKVAATEDTKVVDVDDVPAVKAAPSSNDKLVVAASDKVEVKDEPKVEVKDEDGAIPAVPRTSTVTTAAPATATAEPRGKRATLEPSEVESGRTKRATVEPGADKRRMTPDPDATHSHAAHATVDPDDGASAKTAADVISLPRTMSEEWMAADADDGAYEEGPRRPRWMIPAIAGGIAALGLVVVLAVGGGDDRAQPAPTVAARSIDGSGQGVVSPPPAAPPAAPVAPIVPAVSGPIDAAVAVQPTDTAAVAPVDAPAVAVAPPDAAAVATPPVQVAVAPAGSGAARPVEPPPPPAEVKPPPAEVKPPPAEVKPPPAEVKPKPAEVKPRPAETKPAETKPKPPKPAEPPKDERTIEQLVDAGDLAKANAACKTNTQFSEPRLVACAMAACQTHDLALATRWIRAIPKASRDAMIDKCKAAGTDVQLP